MKKNLRTIIEFALLLTFFVIIPIVIFYGMFPGRIAGTAETTRSFVGVGLIVGAILIFIVVKRMWIDTKIQNLSVRIGMLKDKAYTESDVEVQIKCLKRVAVLKNVRTIVNMIVPALAVLLIFMMSSCLTHYIVKTCNELSQAQIYIERIDKAVTLSCFSFAIGVMLQIIFPWIDLKDKEKEGKK